MPLAFHTDYRVMFEQQFLNAREHIVPFLRSHVNLDGARVLDVGTGDGGVMKALVEAGATGIGVDLSPSRIEFAKEALEQECDAGVLEFVAGDIHDPAVTSGWEGSFDLIVLKDAIEHIHQKADLLRKLASFLRSTGYIFLGFPPWRMPFGGHQQITRSRLGRIPYYHLLPRSAYHGVLRLLGEPEQTIDELLEIRDTRISISDFEDLVRKCDFGVAKRQLYLVNPIYRYKFGLRPRTQIRLFEAIPGFRDFVTTTCYYLIQPLSGYSNE
jgi:SAM-dependent methyltransferase